jgi:hypothetical protein
MSLQRQLRFCCSLAILVLRSCCSGTCCCPLWRRLALAYLLDPLADRLERLGLGRLHRDDRDPLPFRAVLHGRAGAGRCRYSANQLAAFVAQAAGDGMASPATAALIMSAARR